MNRRSLILLVVPLLCQGLTSCSWFSDDDYPVVAAAGDPAQVTPVGQTPAPPAAPGAPAFGAGATPAPVPGTYATAPGAGAAAAAAAPPAAPTAPAAPAANEQIVQHQIVTGDALWKLARHYGTSVERIKQVNQMTSDEIFAGKTILIPSTKVPAGATTVPASTVPAARTAAPTAPMPSATNPVVRPLPAAPAVTVPARDPIAIPRPSGGGF